MLKSHIEDSQFPKQTHLPFENELVSVEGGKQDAEGGKLIRADLPPELASSLPEKVQRLSAESLRAEICNLCIWRILHGVGN